MTNRFPLIAWISLVAFSLVLHVWGLDTRSFHSDEAIHAHTAYKLLHEGAYRYDPTYHGPLLYYLTAASYALFGDSDFTARLPVALSGVALLVVAACLRRPFGQWTAWWTGVLVTISPTVLYYSRFAIMDVLELLTASAALVCLNTIATRPSARPWVWLGIWTALAVSTKENAYVSAALVALVLGLLGSYYGWKTVIGDARAWIWRSRIGVATAVNVFLLIVIPVYTVLLRYPEDWSFPITAIKYWSAQHHVARVAGPWWYYLPRLALYEFLTLIAAAAWVWYRGQRLRAIEGFLCLFASASVVMYAYLGEKVPWLAVHQIWAFFPLAAAQLARTFGPQGRWWSRALAVVGLLATVVTTHTANFSYEEISPHRHRVEALPYVQTTPEFRDLAKTVLKHEQSTDDEPVAAVDGIGTWPLVWYWRHHPVRWSAIDKTIRPPVVITDVEKASAVHLQLGSAYKRERIPVRAWWIMESRPPTVREFFRYALQRQPWTEVGAANVIVFQRAGPDDSQPRQVATPAALKDVLPIDNTAVLGEGWLVEPRGIAIAGDRIAVADTALSQIVMFSAGRFSQTVGSQEQLREPEAVAWNPQGDLYITDTWQHRILALNVQTHDAHPVLALPDGWYGPRSVAVHHDGRVAIADTGHKRIVIADPTLTDIRFIGEAGDAPGKLDEPVGITWVGNSLLVADTGNHRLQLFDNNGQVQRIVPLPGAWPDYYARPQVVALRDNLWLATDLPNAGVWIIRNFEASLIRLRTDGIQPSGLAWDRHTNNLYLSDVGGRLWQFHLTSNEEVAPGVANQSRELESVQRKGETHSDSQQ